MKRSDIVGRVVRRLAPLAPREDPFEIANLVAGEMEAAGMAWDPEEEEMAVKLYAVDSLILSGDSSPAWILSTVPRDCYLTKEVAVDAAALYNRRGAIKEIARRLRVKATAPLAAASLGASTFEAPLVAVDELLRWADRLEGKSASGLCECGHTQSWHRFESAVQPGPGYCTFHTLEYHCACRSFHPTSSSSGA